MRELAKLLLSMFGAVVWASTASAVSIDLTVIDPPGHIPSETIYQPSDTIVLEVSLDSGVEQTEIDNYFFTVVWDSDLLSLSGLDPSSQWMPDFGGSELWSHMNGNLAIDAYGLELNGYNPWPGGDGEPNVFNDEVLATLIFHVIGQGDGGAIISPIFSPGDGVYDGTYSPIPGVVLNSVTILAPEPASSLLVGLGILGIAYTQRRR